MYKARLQKLTRHRIWDLASEAAKSVSEAAESGNIARYSEMHRKLNRENDKAEAEREKSCFLSQLPPGPADCTMRSAALVAKTRASIWDWDLALEAAKSVSEAAESIPYGRPKSCFLFS